MSSRRISVKPKWCVSLDFLIHLCVSTEVIEVRSLILLFFDCRKSGDYTLVEWGNWRGMQLRKRRPADQKPWRFAARGGRWQEAVGRINGFSEAFDGVFVFYRHVWGILFGIPFSFFFCLGRRISIHGLCLEAIGLLRNSVIPVEVRNPCVFSGQPLLVSAVELPRFLSDLQNHFQAKDYHFLITA